MRPRCAGVHILPLNHAQNLLKTYHSEFPKGLYEDDKEKRRNKKISSKYIKRINYDDEYIDENYPRKKRDFRAAWTFVKWFWLGSIVFVGFLMVAVSISNKNNTDNDNTKKETQKTNNTALSSSFSEGKTARESWEDWVNSLSGDAKKGALFWAQVRSQKPPPSCDGSIDFAKACFEAQKRLSSFDTRRNSDPEFRSGWNSL
jgi:hypothetical protein